MCEQMLLHVGALSLVVALNQILHGKGNSMEHSVGDSPASFVRLKLLLERPVEDAPSRVEECGNDDCCFRIVFDFGRKREDAFVRILYMKRMEKPNRSSTCRCLASENASVARGECRCCEEC